MKNFLFIALTISLLSACIGDDIIDDFVEPTFRIMTKADTIAVGDAFQFEARYNNNVGLEEDIPINWTSFDPDILSINNNGLATGITKGTTTVEATVNGPDGNTLSESLEVTVSDTTVVVTTNSRSGTIKTTTFYELEGEFEMTMEDDRLIISIDDSYKASRSLPGLYVYLTNNPTTTNGAFEIGEVDVFSGAHTYELENIDINDYNYILYFCKPFNVKVGDGEISQ